MTDGRVETDSLGEGEPVPGAQRGGWWRWGVPLVLIGVYWGLVEYAYRASMDGFSRFMTRVLPCLGLLLFFSVWWLTLKSIRGRHRLLVALAMPLLLTAGVMVSDKTVDAIGMLLTGVPWICLFMLAWLWMSQGTSSLRRALGVVAVGAVVFGAQTLVRWNGLDGRQGGSFSWRWTPTAEDQFLESHKAAPVVATSELARPVVYRPGDWPGFRGVDRNGTVPEANLAHWSASPPEVVWRHKVGPGWSSFAVVDGLLFTQEQRGEVEAVVCYDAQTGRERWARESTARFDEALSGSGPRSTPTFADGRIYAIGAKGDLHCLAADTGDVVWSENIFSKYGGKVPQWGYASSPLVVDDVVYVFAGGAEGQSLLALDAATGTARWCSAGGEQTYASPHLATLDGVRQLLMHDDKALRGVDPANGSVLWEIPVTTATFQPMIQPHAVGERALLVATQDGGVSLWEVKQVDGQWTTDEKWESKGLKPAFNDCYIHKGHVYGLDDGILCCLSLETGKKLWKKGRYGAGQLLLLPDADQLLVVTESPNQLILVDANPKELRELAVVPGLEGKTWNHAAYAHGRLYIRNGEEMACLKCGSGSHEAVSPTGGEQSEPE